MAELCFKTCWFEGCENIRYTDQIYMLPFLGAGGNVDIKFLSVEQRGECQLGENTDKMPVHFRLPSHLAQGNRQDQFRLSHFPVFSTFVLYNVPESFGSHQGFYSKT